MTVIDERTVESFVQRVLGVLVDAATAQMVHLGDRLGLYRGLVDGGPVTPAELAMRTGLGERYVAEWLAQQASVGFLGYEPATGRFTLPAEHAMVLATDDSPAALGGAFEALTGWHLGIDDLAEAFRSGQGIEWDAHDERVFRGVTRFFGTAYRAHLVDDWVPALGVAGALRQGARVADVGCGDGVATVLLAQAFPHSRFVGFYRSERAVLRARQRAVLAGVRDRVRFEVADAAAFGDGPYDLIWFFDSLHDLGDPVAAATRARQQLADQGTVGVVEPYACDDPAANIAGNPGAGLQYTASTFLCVPHSLAEPGRAALGAQAGGRLLAQTLRAGGLTHTERVARTPLHAVYAAHSEEP